MDKEQLKELIIQGNSYRKIAEITGYSKSSVDYWARKHGVNIFVEKPKRKNIYFDKIDTKEKAYFLGFLLADGNIDIKDVSNFKIQLRDREILDFFTEWYEGKVIVSHKYDKKSGQFPSARWDRKIADIRKFTGGRLKPDRRIPIIKKDLERYLLQGFFDADGGIYFGTRRKKGGLWYNVKFTSQLKLLEGIQQILLKRLLISTVIRPKKDCNTFVLEFSAKSDILTFLNFIYPDEDFIILKRKYLKSKALRLELGEFGERGINEVLQSRAEPAKEK